MNPSKCLRNILILSFFILPLLSSQRGRASALEQQSLPVYAGPSASIQANRMSDGVVIFSFLLWAGALVAIVLLMFYLWRSGSVLRHKGKAREAEPQVQEQAIQSTETAAVLSRADLENGVELVCRGKASEGIAELNKVIHTEPENEIAWFWLGIASARERDYRSGERCLLQAKRYGHPYADKALEWLRKQK